MDRFDLIFFIYKSPRYFLPSLKSFGLSIQKSKQKEIFLRWRPSWTSDRKDISCFFFLFFFFFFFKSRCFLTKKVREKSRECHNHKPQPFPGPERKRKPTNLNKHKPNKRTKSTKISFLFPKRDNRNTKRTEKHKNKMTHGKTYNKSPRRINHKATNSKTNTGTTALERSVDQTTGGFTVKHFYS